eukprot:gene21027-23081_t
MVIIPTDNVQPDNLKPKGLEASLRGLDLDTATKGNDNGEYDDLIAIGDMPTLDTDATVRIRTGKGNYALNFDGRLGASSRCNLVDAELGPEEYNTLNFGAIASDLPISFSEHTGRLECNSKVELHTLSKPVTLLVDQQSGIFRLMTTQKAKIGSNRKKRQSDNSVLKKIFGINDFSEKRQLQCASNTGNDPILNPRRRRVVTIAFNTKCPGVIRANTRRIQCVTRRRSKFELDTKFYPGKKHIVDFQKRNYQDTDLADYVTLECPSSTVSQTTTIDLSSPTGDDDSDTSD